MIELNPETERLAKLLYENMGHNGTPEGRTEAFKLLFDAGYKITAFSPFVESDGHIRLGTITYSQVSFTLVAPPVFGGGPG